MWFGEVKVIQPLRPPLPSVFKYRTVTSPPFGSDAVRRPHPCGDPVSEAASFLVAAESVKVAAATMANKAAGQAIVESVNSGVNALIDDDICPRWPKPGPPWPGPVT